jgi:hypothetical protein
VVTPLEVAPTKPPITGIAAGGQRWIRMHHQRAGRFLEERRGGGVLGVGDRRPCARRRRSASSLCEVSAAATIWLLRISPVAASASSQRGDTSCSTASALTTRSSSSNSRLSESTTGVAQRLILMTSETLM